MRFTLPVELAGTIRWWRKRSDRQGFAYLSLSDHPTRAIVFVHGFAGGPWSTWANFHTMVSSGLEGQNWVDSDLFFWT